MSQPPRFSPAARREFAKALKDIEHIAAAERLKRVVDLAVRRIGDHPALGRRELALADARYRLWSVPGFPYIIFYRPDRTSPAVVRFVHTARDLPRMLADLRDSATPDQKS